MSSKLTPSLAGDGGRLLLAEAVLPGHPDKLADQIADSIVDIAVERDGPRVPIGGGALSGKDPWRLDPDRRIPHASDRAGDRRQCAPPVSMSRRFRSG